MNKLILPETLPEKKQAHERLISQLFSNTDLLLPPPLIGKEKFLSRLIIEYKRNKNLPSKLESKYGKITNPVDYLLSVKNEPWEMEGVMDFYFNHWFVRRSKEIKKKTKTKRRGCGLEYGITSSFHISEKMTRYGLILNLK